METRNTMLFAIVLLSILLAAGGVPAQQGTAGGQGALGGGAAGGQGALGGDQGTIGGQGTIGREQGTIGGQGTIGREQGTIGGRGAFGEEQGRSTLDDRDELGPDRSSALGGQYATGQERETLEFGGLEAFKDTRGAYDENYEDDWYYDRYEDDPGYGEDEARGYYGDEEFSWFEDEGYTGGFYNDEFEADDWYYDEYEDYDRSERGINIDNERMQGESFWEW